MNDLSGLIARLEQISEELGDAAIQCLREALEGDESAAGLEKRINRARRAVDKAAGVLAGMPADD